MPFTIVRNDITKMSVDAIVNTANPHPVIGPGTDSAIHQKAGPELLAARQKIGIIQAGCAAITPAFELDAQYVIHTVGPVWRDGGHGEAALLRNCYDNALRLALQHGCLSIAFPLISTGYYGFPKDRALQIAISAFSAFLLEHEMQIYLVVFDSKSYKLSGTLFRDVASYIDENLADAGERSIAGENRRLRRRRKRAMEVRELPVMECSRPALSLEEMLKQEDAGFSETLLKLIDKSGWKDSQVYKKALLSKQHFSKIRNNPDYKPTKTTAIALALALELDLDGTKDLIGRAGYALTSSSKFDLIIRYFIQQGNYNVVEINCALYEFDQVLLGS
jgi:O-acetyl-ADP-ribose deacetylase (regulator of RNase III)